LNVECEFLFVDGQLDTEPRNGVEKYFEGPFLSYYDWDSPRSLHKAYDFLYQVVKNSGPYDGLLGFSQGGSLASSFLLHHMCHHPTQPVEAMFRFGIFICSGNPFDARGETTRRYHPDEDELRIDIPVANIVGSKDDEYVRQQLLYRLCNPQKAVLYDHGGGHEIPRNASAMKGMTTAICGIVSRAYLV